MLLVSRDIAFVAVRITNADWRRPAAVEVLAHVQNMVPWPDSERLPQGLIKQRIYHQKRTMPTMLLHRFDPQHSILLIGGGSYYGAKSQPRGNGAHRQSSASFSTSGLVRDVRPGKLEHIGLGLIVLAGQDANLLRRMPTTSVLRLISRSTPRHHPLVGANSSSHRRPGNRQLTLVPAPTSTRFGNPHLPRQSVIAP